VREKKIKEEREVVSIISTRRDEVRLGVCDPEREIVDEVSRGGGFIILREKY